MRLRALSYWLRRDRRLILSYFVVSAAAVALSGSIVAAMAILGIGGGFLVLLFEHEEDLERRALVRAVCDWNSQLFGYREELRKKKAEMEAQLVALRRERIRIALASLSGITKELSSAFEKVNFEAANFEEALNNLATVELHRRKAELLGRRSPFAKPASTLRPKDKPRPFVSMPRPRDNA